MATKKLRAKGYSNIIDTDPDKEGTQFRPGKFVEKLYTADLNPRAEGTQSFQDLSQRIKASPRDLLVTDAIASGKVKSGLKPLDVAGQFAGTYLKNRVVDPFANIPQNLRTTFSKDATIPERGIAGAQALFGLPIFMGAEDVAFSALEGAKSGLAGRNAFKGFSGEETTGLGTTIASLTGTEGGTTEQVLNFAEFPLLIAAGVSPRVGGREAVEQAVRHSPTSVRIGQQTFDAFDDIKPGKFINTDSVASSVLRNSDAVENQLIRLRTTPGNEFTTARPLPKRLKTAPDKKIKTLAKRVYENEEFSPAMKAKIAQGDISYSPKPIRIAKIEAQKIMDDEGLDSVASRLTRDGISNDTEAILAESTIAQLDSAGQHDRASDLALKIAEEGLIAGRTVNSFKVFSQRTPQGMVNMAQRELRKARESRNFVDRLFGRHEIADFSNEELTQIRRLMNRANRAENEIDKLTYTKQAMEIINDHIPLNASEIFDAYRYSNMLSNPRSQMRNWFGNALNAFAVEPATMLNEAFLDMVGATLTGKARQTYFRDVPMHYVRAYNALPNSVEAFMKAMSGQIDIAKDADLRVMRTSKFTGPVGKSLTFTGRFMEASDQFLQTMLFESERARLMAKGVDEAVANTQALDKARQLLYRSVLDPKNRSGQGNLLSGIDQLAKNYITLRKNDPTGLTKVMTPFVSIATNIAKAWIEYTPGVGMTTMIGNTKKSRQLAKQMVGATVMLYGVNRAIQGKTTWSVPTDEKGKRAFYSSGKKPYSFGVELPNGKTAWIPISYLGPLGLAMGLPAAWHHYHSDAPTAISDSESQKLAKVGISALQLLSQQTFLENVGQVVRILSGDVDEAFLETLAFSSGQVIPAQGLVRYITTLMDRVHRNPDGFVEEIKSGLPWMSKELEPHTNILNEPSRRNITDYVTPWSIGISDPQYEPLYETLQQAQQRKKFESKLESESEELVKKYKLKTSPGELPAGRLQDRDLQAFAVAYNVDEIIDMPENSTLARIKKRNKAYPKALDILEDPELPQEVKNGLIKGMGLEPEEVEYYSIAKLENSEKIAYVMDVASTSNWNHDDLLRQMARWRKAAKTKMIASDGVIDVLEEQGFLTKSEAKQLKSMQWDESSQKFKLKTGSSRSSGSVSVPKPRLKSVSSVRVPSFGTVPKSTARINLQTVQNLPKIQLVQPQQ